MKKLVTYIFILLITVPLYAGSNLIFLDSDTGEKLGYMSKESFQILVNTSDFYKRILESEKEGLLTITTDTNIILVEDKEIKVPIYVQWKDVNSNQVIKKLEGEILLTLDSVDNVDKRTLYSKLAEIGFPVSIGFNLALGLILILIV